MINTKLNRYRFLHISAKWLINDAIERRSAPTFLAISASSCLVRACSCASCLSRSSSCRVRSSSSCACCCSCCWCCCNCCCCCCICCCCCCSCCCCCCNCCCCALESSSLLLLELAAFCCAFCKSSCRNRERDHSYRENPSCTIISNLHLNIFKYQSELQPINDKCYVVCAYFKGQYFTESFIQSFNHFHGWSFSREVGGAKSRQTQNVRLSS